MIIVIEIKQCYTGYTVSFLQINLFLFIMRYLLYKPNIINIVNTVEE